MHQSDFAVRLVQQLYITSLWGNDVPNMSSTWLSTCLCLLASWAIMLIGPVFFHSNISKTHCVLFIRLTVNLLSSVSFPCLTAVNNVIQMNRFLVTLSRCKQVFHSTLSCEEMNPAWVKHASPQRNRNNECFVSTIQECSEFLKTLVNNLAALRLLTQQPEPSSFSDNTQHLSLSETRLTSAKLSAQHPETTVHHMMTCRIVS